MRCSGWRFYSSQESLGDSSDGFFKWSGLTSGFFPVEETDPYELNALMTKIFRCAQENEQEAHSPSLFD